MKDIPNKFDVIILSLVVDPYTHSLTKCCIESYLATADDLINKIYVIETNSKFVGSYNSNKVEVILPHEEFNYNRFYNIGLSKCTAQYVIGPNNDVIVKPGCLQAMLESFNSNPELYSLSPVNREWPRHKQMYLPQTNKLYYGYITNLHLLGCMFAARRKTFDIIGYLDESFYFYYQDDDYSACLRRNNLLHAVHTGAEISHKNGSSSKYSSSKYQYSNKISLQNQQNLFIKKWIYTDPFKTGGFVKFKPYCFC
jgi:hypothetical protein